MDEIGAIVGRIEYLSKQIEELDKDRANLLKKLQEKQREKCKNREQQPITARFGGPSVE